MEVDPLLAPTARRVYLVFRAFSIWLSMTLVAVIMIFTGGWGWAAPLRIRYTGPLP